MNGSYYSPTAGASPYYERSPPTTTKKLAQPSFEIKPTMDLCNLYVKGIEPGLTSSDLFNLFKPFGRIISARVMEDASSSSSSNKGFGFVSFSQSIEAAQALIAMHQPTDDNKNTIGVRFHEPRVPRPEHNFGQQLAILSQHTELAPHFYTRSKHDNKITPLRPMMMIVEDQQDTTNTSYASQTTMYYASPPPPPLPPYYYPTYWTDHRGVIYTNVYHPYVQQSSSMIYDDDDTKQKLLDMLEQQANISPLDQKQLKQKLLALSPAEQTNCTRHPVYFKEKINAFLLQLQNNTKQLNDDTEQDVKK